MKPFDRFVSQLKAVAAQPDRRTAVTLTSGAARGGRNLLSLSGHLNGFLYVRPVGGSVWYFAPDVAEAMFLHRPWALVFPFEGKKEGYCIRGSFIEEGVRDGRFELNSAGQARITEEDARAGGQHFGSVRQLYAMLPEFLAP